MKISIAWAFDHIDANLQGVDIAKLVSKIGQTTAEVEELRSITTNLDLLSVAHVIEVANKVRAYSPEWQQEIVLGLRDRVFVGEWYLIIKRANSYEWCTTVDVGGEKEMLMPPLDVSEEALKKGAWKNAFEVHDFVCKIDNKSITHRPDLWGHRGFAREIAALLKVPLKPIENFLTHHPVEPRERTVAGGSPITISIEDEELCRRFAGLYISKIEVRPSVLRMVTRLARVDSRAINAVVDATNYVMFDLGQPMHAFDADQLSSKAITVRRARNREQLITLDDQTFELCSNDLVIADGAHPVALAGVMGGKRSGIEPHTTSLFLESANFDATTIRRTSQRYKIRTEASTRFEKNLDPNQNTDAIKRFLMLMTDARISYTAADPIISLGKLAQPLNITITHSFIEARLGTTVAPRFICDTLESLSCEVQEISLTNEPGYHIIVPTFRSTKDITISEDIVEEIGRFYGYGTLIGEPPLIETKPSLNREVHHVSRIKRFLAYGLSMRELYSYALFDESFLKTMAWDPKDAAEIRDPLSAQWHRLVTTLIPHLIKAVLENSVDHDRLRFFEWARCWKLEGERVVEHKSLAGIFFEKKQPVDFYETKAFLEQFFNMLGLSVNWQHVNERAHPWLHTDMSACITYDGKTVGVAGLVDESWWRSLAEGSAFIFELDGDFLEQYQHSLHRFIQPSRYPAVERDVSLFAPFSLTVQELMSVIAKIDNRIEDIRLVDLFQKKEWKDHRALTVRYVIRDAHKTLTKAEIEQIHKQVTKAVVAAGATVR